MSTLERDEEEVAHVLSIRDCLGGEALLTSGFANLLHAAAQGPCTAHLPAAKSAVL